MTDSHREKIGHAAAELMDKIEGYGEHAEVREVIVLAEVTTDDGISSSIDWWSSTLDPYKQAGILAVASRASIKRFERDVEPRDDDEEDLF